MRDPALVIFKALLPIEWVIVSVKRASDANITDGFDDLLRLRKRPILVEVEISAAPAPFHLLMAIRPQKTATTRRTAAVDRLVEWRGGIAPPRSPRTGREPLDSSGSCHPVALRRDSELPTCIQESRTGCWRGLFAEGCPGNTRVGSCPDALPACIAAGVLPPRL
jgi:hypothetical protein